MGTQIIRKENGKFALWSRGREKIIADDLTREEVISHFVNYEIQRIQVSVGFILDMLEKGENPYMQFQLTYKEAIRYNEVINLPNEEGKENDKN